VRSCQNGSLVRIERLVKTENQKLRTRN
jgi:hypothetical protein